MSASADASAVDEQARYCVEDSDNVPEFLSYEEISERFAPPFGEGDLEHIRNLLPGELYRYPALPITVTRARRVRVVVVFDIDCIGSTADPAVAIDAMLDDGVPQEDIAERGRDSDYFGPMNVANAEVEKSEVQP